VRVQEDRLRARHARARVGGGHAVGVGQVIADGMVLGDGGQRQSAPAAPISPSTSRRPNVLRRVLTTGSSTLLVMLALVAGRDSSTAPGPETIAAPV
jgi:hypothetical protein